MRPTGILVRILTFCAAGAVAGGARAGGDGPRTGATAILQHLDLDTFPNSTGPRRRRLLHTPADYGFSKLERFDDGWTQISEPDDGWHLSAFLLDRGKASATICFVDAGGRGATYRATQVLRVKLGGNARWAAVQIADRPGCRNDPPFPA